MTLPKAGFCMGQAQLVNYIISKVGVQLFVVLCNITVHTCREDRYKTGIHPESNRNPTR
jgi:hypothetical protein